MITGYWRYRDIRKWRAPAPVGVLPVVNRDPVIDLDDLDEMIREQYPEAFQGEDVQMDESVEPSERSGTNIKTVPLDLIRSYHRKNSGAMENGHTPRWKKK